MKEGGGGEREKGRRKHGKRRRGGRETRREGWTDRMEAIGLDTGVNNKMLPRASVLRLASEWLRKPD